MTSVKIVSDRQTLVDQAAELIISKIQTAIAQKGICTIALAGGSTPKPIYEIIAQTDLPWDKIHVFWGDERYVAYDHPDSNYKMTQEAWLNKVNLPSDNIHPMPTDGDNPQQDAAKHEQQLLDFFKITDFDITRNIPHFDLILLADLFKKTKDFTP